MRALTGLSCSQTGKTGATGKAVSMGAGVLFGLVLRGFRTLVLSAGLPLRLGWGGCAATGALDAAGAGAGSGAASALDAETLRGLAALTSGAF